MNSSTSSLFSQLLSLVDRSRFARLVRDTGSGRRCKGFASWGHFVAMLFCQLAQARSLRGIGAGLGSCEGKFKHLGMAGATGRPTLSCANSKRSAGLFERVFRQLPGTVTLHVPGKKFRFKSKLYSLDSTVIELCATMFDWAKFRATKGAAKLHLLLDHNGHLPCFATITEGKVAAVTVAQQLKLPKGSLIVMDRGYNDHRLFERWTSEGVGFVTRLKKIAIWASHEERPVKAGGKVRRDTVGCFVSFDASRFRRVTVWIDEKGVEMELLTNRFEFSAETIAGIYKQCWQIELFFKAIKQNLRINTFVGTSANAVLIQIWAGLIAVLLFKLLQFRSRIDWALSNLVALLRWNFLSRRDLWKWIDDPFLPQPEPPPQPSFQPGSQDGDAFLDQGDELGLLVLVIAGSQRDEGGGEIRGADHAVAVGGRGDSARFLDFRRPAGSD